MCIDLRLSERSHVRKLEQCSKLQQEEQEEEVDGVEEDEAEEEEANEEEEQERDLRGEVGGEWS